MIAAAWLFLRGLSWQVYAAAALVAALGLSHAWAYRKGEASTQRSWDAATVKAEAEAQVKTASLAESAQLLRKARDAEMDRTNAALAAALLGLRNRPQRLPEPARTACEGSTGRELSEPDAGFLTRLAAEADTVRTALDECQAWAEAVRK